MKYFTILLLIFCCHFIAFSQVESEALKTTPTQSIATTTPESKLDSVLAIVNGEPITGFDVIMRTESEEKKLRDIFSGSNLFNKITELRKQTLEELISRKLIYAKYNANPRWTISNQDIENLLDDFRKSCDEKSRASLEKHMEERYGYTPERLKEYARETIAVEGMIYYECERNVYVSPKEVYEEFEKNREKWTKPETISLQVLQCELKTTEQIKNANDFRKSLPACPDQDEFAKAVTKFFPSGSGVTISEVTDTERKKLRDEFKEALKDATVNYVAGPIDISGTGFFLRVISIEPEKLEPFSKINKDITATLKRKKVEETRKAYEETLRNNAYIQYFIQ